MPHATADSAPAAHRCGTVALVGRPNVGKSTLLNALIGWRLSIVGPRPQTTRHRILGVCTRPAGQMLFLDTPGLHRGRDHALNRLLNRAARGAIVEADVVVQVIEAGRWLPEDDDVYAALASARRPRLLAINKVDTQKDKRQLLPFLAAIEAAHPFDAVYLVSARRRDGLGELERGILEHLPEAPAAFPEDAITDRSERFLAGERIREQVMRQLAQELPYAATVEIESFREQRGAVRIEATIWVERESQKGIVIGAGGARLKAIGTAARLAIERLFERRVHLRLHVRVCENWSEDETALRRFGYAD
jgi:GTP-binding protein Era